MVSFFDKLKKGMGVDEPAGEPVEPARNALSHSDADGEKLKKAKVKKEKDQKPDKKTVEIKAESPEEKEPSFAKATEGKEKIEMEKTKIKEKWFEPEGQLAIDVYQTEEYLVIQSAIAGVKPDSLDISVEGDMVLIKGRREKPEEKDDRNYFYQECYWGPFSRQIILSVEVDPSRTEAILKEGILTVRIPKIDRERKRKIMVQG